MNEKIKKIFKNIALSFAFVFACLACFFAGTKQRRSSDKGERAESVRDELEAIGNHQQLSAERLRQGMESIDRVRSREEEVGRIIRESQDIIARVRERAKEGNN